MRTPSFSVGRPESITLVRTSAPPNSPSQDSATDRAPGIPFSESSSLRYDASHCAWRVAGSIGPDGGAGRSSRTSAMTTRSGTKPGSIAEM